MARNSNQKSIVPQPSESLVAQALERIAAILLRAGMDSPAAEQLLRRAFISAANRLAEPKGKKATQSQIAALAGVSRLEVRRVLARGSAKQSEPKSRIGKLVSAWRNDSNFTTLKGLPRPLRFHGPNSEFDDLVRKYGRDVTKKSLLDQLLTLGIARERNGKITLIRGNPSVNRAAAASSDLRFVASQLSNIDFELGHREYTSRRISIPAKERKTAEAIRRIALSRLDTVMNSLETMADAPSGARKMNRSIARRLLVCTMVALESGEAE